MKTVLILAIFVLTLGKAYNQTSPVTLTKEDYLKKSKNQKTAAWVMLIGGTVAITIGIAVSLSGAVDQAFGSPTSDKNQTFADVITIAGSAAVLGSIPLFICCKQE